MSKLVKKKRMIKVNTFVWKDKKDSSKGGSVKTTEVEQTVLIPKLAPKSKE